MIDGIRGVKALEGDRLFIVDGRPVLMRDGVSSVDEYWEDLERSFVKGAKKR